MDRKHFIVFFFVLIFLGFVGVVYGVDQLKMTNTGSKNGSYKELRSQAQKARKAYPELFQYLEERELAIQNSLLALNSKKPNPNAWPIGKIPVLPWIELMAPQSEGQCQQILQRTDLSTDFKERLYQICKRGIYRTNPSFTWSR
ncbi:MAG: hypothetical protein MRJ96_14455 [Nitrospirales bacterium]|nr:hypothetical protein [Nitrospira sp.]MDR4502642.1 hypothetical protein [Nitrospirales bacterium]